MKCTSISAVLSVLLLLHYSESISRNSRKIRASTTKDTSDNLKDSITTHHNRIRHKRITPHAAANIKFEDNISTSNTDLNRSNRIKYKKTPRVHRKRRKEFVLNYPFEKNDNVTNPISNYPTTKAFENLMDIKLDLTILNDDDEAALAKERVLTERTRSLCRRRRYTVPYGIGYYNNVQTYVPCTSWSTYQTHGCITGCVGCRNPCTRYPKPATYTPVPIYQGTGKDWYGPKYGKLI